MTGLLVDAGIQTADLLSSVTELKMSSNHTLSPITFIPAPSCLTALQTLDIGSLSIFGPKPGSGFNHSKFDLGPLSFLLIPSVDFLDLISPVNEVSHLGIASWIYSHSNETAEAHIARTVPSLQRLETVSYKHWLC